MGAIPNLQVVHVHSIAYPTIAFASSNPSARSLLLSNLNWAPTPTRLKSRKQSRKVEVLNPKAAAADEGKTTEVAPESDTKDGDFEERLAKIRRKVRSGSGKKAELRKLKKAGMDPSKVKGKRTGILLPPIPLKDPMSGGLKVELGFNSYSERLNGKFAALGLAALLLVELGSAKSLLNYHAPGTLILQTYFVLAVSALVVKYEKEKNSVWPKSKS